MTRILSLLVIASLVMTGRVVAQTKLQTKVWVNHESGRYHCPGTPYYGKTAKGEYMKEAAARALRYHASRGDACADNATPDSLPGASTTSVWVNTDSGVYFCPGNRSYGKTKRGKFLSEAKALGEGYKPSRRKPCATAGS